jgi:hypothetical protein
VRQKFTLDDDPERWDECCERTLRIHLIDEKEFERETGVRLDTYKNAPSQASHTAFVTPDPRSRRDGTHCQIGLVSPWQTNSIYSGHTLRGC